MKPIHRFLKSEAASGLVLFLVALLALVIANSPFQNQYFSFLHHQLGWDFGGESSLLQLRMSVLHWINDGLMTLFFFVVGLEIKRELTVGELATPRKAALPIFAAVGGMIIPAAIFLGFNIGTSEARGWGIPMATDIAFAVGILALLGRRIPQQLKIFLLALAIVDDLGAVLAIAFFYTDQISGAALGFAALGLGIVVLMNRTGVEKVAMYFLVGIAVWLFFLKSGVHPTIAGVILGLLTPQKGRLVHSTSPIESLISRLHPWVNFAIMPLFAFANAGVSLNGFELSNLLQSRLAAGIILGLLVGKPIGIFSAAWLSRKLKVSEFPTGVTVRHLWGAGLLGGVGFTMALFVSQLAVRSPEVLDIAKASVFLASTCAGIFGAAILFGARPAVFKGHQSQK